MEYEHPKMRELNSLAFQGNHRLTAQLLCIRLSPPPLLMKISQAFMTVREF